jgi:hypothetical protein
MQGVATTNDLIYEYEELAAELDAERQKILTRLQTLQDSSRNWQQIEKDMKIQIARSPTKIKIDCGGSIFHTSRTTLLKFPFTLFHAILATDIWDPRKSPDVEKGVYFFDRDPLGFDAMLDYLRDSVLNTDSFSDLDMVKALKGHLEFCEVPFNESQHNGKCTHLIVLRMVKRTIDSIIYFSEIDPRGSWDRTPSPWSIF